jgi:hypothetical protein
MILSVYGEIVNLKITGGAAGVQTRAYLLPLQQALAHRLMIRMPRLEALLIIAPMYRQAPTGKTWLKTCPLHLPCYSNQTSGFTTPILKWLIFIAMYSRIKKKP